MGLEGGDGEGEEGEEEEEGEISPMCESISHRPLRGRCPKRAKRNNHLLLCEAPFLDMSVSAVRQFVGIYIRSTSSARPLRASKATIYLAM